MEFDVENMLNEMVRQQSDYPPLLYHYCKVGSAKYLLDRNADIGARSVFRSPNDPAEYSFGVGLFLGYVAQKRLLPQKIVDILYIQLVNNLIAGKINKSSIIPFVFCLTDEFNSPYHWDEFVGKDGGFCFVFSTRLLAEAIRNIVRDNKASLRIEKCYYVGYDNEAINCYDCREFNASGC